MGKKDIIGRVEEKALLELASKSSEAEFIVVYGRRRVGKTHLVSEFFGDSICFEITGIHGVTLKEQLDNFAQSLGRAIGMGIQPQRPSAWTEAFQQLEQFLNTPIKRKKKGKRVVFLDELPWLNTPRSKFLSSLEHFWNRWGSRQRDLVLVICGSAASWMIQNIVRARGGLHNRLTRQIRLLPFTLSETRDFLQSKGVRLTSPQIVELYMAMGGVPHYLKQAEPGLSAAQIIDKTCFSPQGLLREEFKNLYASLFDNNIQHQKIVRVLAAKRRGLTRNEILKISGLRTGGSASRRIEELEESGFIQSHVPFGKKVNDTLYRLSDEYSLFYLHWIEQLGKKSFGGESHWLQQLNSPRRKAWSGFTFEGLCLKHIEKLKAALGIANVETKEGPWYYRAVSGSDIPGAQIDLLIDRRDNTINLCEIKHADMEFTIDKAYAEMLRRKLTIFQRVTKTRKNIFLTMVTTFGVMNNAHSRELVAKSLTLEDLFQ